MPPRRAHLRRARHWIANRGLRGFLTELLYRLKLKLKGEPTPGRENGNTAPHPFDLAYGTDTGGLLWGEALDAKNSWATGYYGISPSAFTAALQSLRLDWRSFTFVDIGCGKGRALLLASRLPFREITGVELSPTLAGTARHNTEIFKAPWRCPQTRLTVHAGDALTTPLPAGPLVVFLYHPFAAPVMRRFLAHLGEAARQQSRPIYVLYANPELESLFLSTPGLQGLWKQTFDLTPEEGAADRFGSHGEIFAAYQLIPT